MRFRFSSLSKKKTRISIIQTAKSDNRALVVALLRGAIRMLRPSTVASALRTYRCVIGRQLLRTTVLLNIYVDNEKKDKRTGLFISLLDLRTYEVFLGTRIISNFKFLKYCIRLVYTRIRIMCQRSQS